MKQGIKSVSNNKSLLKLVRRNFGIMSDYKERKNKTIHNKGGKPHRILCLVGETAKERSTTRTSAINRAGETFPPQPAKRPSKVSPRISRATTAKSSKRTSNASRKHPRSNAPKKSGLVNTSFLFRFVTSRSLAVTMLLSKPKTFILLVVQGPFIYVHTSRSNHREQSPH